ncbi:tRNA 5-methoxyuridine(34)/uridine 5-oxyacetic acid(34) synthase CmoB [Sulfurospirillum sp. T05]|uniref:tRNA 5-methoxyuridine(34)/uridine 5-oxyacetic acid(34) synthase CmoB n=1 Tax=Sulfurospirillum tamanense TaxID=2813362 RepID=A0ABS2WQ80_9BACT|nr:tRNA 5-methoxyuridine(34)/uridine 5-oxyacetic acid(34) synthase CmoB [Sulfurospirillum tamanensis]MBN2963737.1 tRNA 5-methoxyuridine(34)/uridine 5-oxyacetic acid(34) synthase CmoB [Sulfurospirillum tamanensis]
MTLDALRKERQAWLTWKNIAPLRDLLATLPDPGGSTFTCNDIFTLKNPTFCPQTKEEISRVAWELRPWRKGPFNLFGTLIDTEWQSFMKYNLLAPHLNLEGKIVGDIGCNNGYYLFRLLEKNPKLLVGFDPSPLYKTQFDFINHFAQTQIVYELLGIEHLPLYEHRFDTLLCLGVLYHRSDPVGALKALAKGLTKEGELFLDTFMIDGDEPVALCPGKSYSKIPNIYHIPTIKALENWGEKAGFGSMEVLDIVPTNSNEQRKTEWILGESLENFLDPNDATKTIEGYPAPKRLYVKFLR